MAPPCSLLWVMVMLVAVRPGRPFWVCLPWKGQAGPQRTLLIIMIMVLLVSGTVIGQLAEPSRAFVASRTSCCPPPRLARARLATRRTRVCPLSPPQLRHGEDYDGVSSNSIVVEPVGADDFSNQSIQQGGSSGTVVNEVPGSRLETIGVCITA